MNVHRLFESKVSTMEFRISPPRSVPPPPWIPSGNVAPRPDLCRPPSRGIPGSSGLLWAPITSPLCIISIDQGLGLELYPPVPTSQSWSLTLLSASRVHPQIRPHPLLKASMDLKMPVGLRKQDRCMQKRQKEERKGGRERGRKEGKRKKKELNHILTPYTRITQNDLKT